MSSVAPCATASRNAGGGTHPGRLSLATVVGGPPPGLGPPQPRVPLRRCAQAHTMLDRAWGMKASGPVGRARIRAVTCGVRGAGRRRRDVGGGQLGSFTRRAPVCPAGPPQPAAPLPQRTPCSTWSRAGSQSTPSVPSAHTMLDSSCGRNSPAGKRATASASVRARPALATSPSAAAQQARGQRRWARAPARRAVPAAALSPPLPAPTAAAHAPARPHSVLARPRGRYVGASSSTRAMRRRYSGCRMSARATPAQAAGSRRRAGSVRPAVRRRTASSSSAAGAATMQAGQQAGRRRRGARQRTGLRVARAPRQLAQPVHGGGGVDAVHEAARVTHHAQHRAQAAAEGAGPGARGAWWAGEAASVLL